MEMNKKRITVIAAIILLIIIIVLLVVFIPRKEQPATVVKTEIPVAENKPDAKPAVVVAPPTASEVQHASISYLSRMFCERLGTFTNQSGYLSITDLLPMMTSSMKNWIEKTYLPKLQKDYPQNGLLYRVTSIAPVANITLQGENQATVVVESQRTEKYGDNAEKSFFEDLKLNLVKINNNWLVDGAYWQNKR